MKIAAVFALAFLKSLLLAFAQENDQANAVLQTERDLAAAFSTATPKASRRV